MASHRGFSSLADGEYTVLRGGFGGAAKWVWGGFMGFTFAAMCVAAIVMFVKGEVKTEDLVSMGVLMPLLGVATIVPWLRSGRFELTNQRLSWKPTLGKLREMPLASIAKIEEVNPNTSKVIVRLKDGAKVKMRNLGGWKKLWSALLLYRAPGMGEPLPPVTGQVSHLVYRAPRQQGRSGLQNGTLVFRPQRAWYLPDAAVLNLLGEAIGNMFKGQHTVQPELPTAEHVKRLARGSDDEFDRRVGLLCEHLGGLSFAPGEANVTRKPAKLRKSHDVVRVSSPNGVLQKGVERQQLDALGWFDRWLQL